MTLLVLGLTLFIGVHLLRELGLREPLMARLGAGPYKALYSLLALLGVAGIVAGKSAAPFVQLWQPAFEHRWLTHYLMLPAFILVAAGNLPPSHVRSHLQHPMLLGTVMWGAAHLWANGDMASALLFGGIGAWALLKFIVLCLRPPTEAPAPSWVWDVAAVLVGLVLYGLILIYHGPLFGMGLTLG